MPAHSPILPPGAGATSQEVTAQIERSRHVSFGLKRSKFSYDICGQSAIRMLHCSDAMPTYPALTVRSPNKQSDRQAEDVLDDIVTDYLFSMASYDVGVK
jgi:hypothetical protein